MTTLQRPLVGVTLLTSLQQSERIIEILTTECCASRRRRAVKDLMRKAYGDDLWCVLMLGAQKCVALIKSNSLDSS